MDLREGANRLKVAYTDVSGTLNYHRRDTLFGHESKTTIGWRTTKHLPNSGASEFVRVQEAGNAPLAVGERTRDFSYQGSDTVLHLGNDLELSFGRTTSSLGAHLEFAKGKRPTVPDAAN
ncbi:hypothetical protein WR25_26631 [Diploscapter pachys]|uniref:Uncharacterized protein n=1 Tax=Diploscapter pachys TaxID=2018661 RepID=A0A2A2K7U0_9BILA|nr:hypothetical protein WR25_26631 [Diploscapter pachys]